MGWVGTPVERLSTRALKIAARILLLCAVIEIARVEERWVECSSSIKQQKKCLTLSIVCATTTNSKLTTLTNPFRCCDDCDLRTRTYKREKKAKRKEAFSLPLFGFQASNLLFECRQVSFRSFFFHSFPSLVSSLARREAELSSVCVFSQELFSSGWH